MRCVATQVRLGEGPIEALADVKAMHRDVALRPLSAQARMVLVGEPWSLHVDGDGQGRIGAMLCELGVEIETPPLLLWLRYQLWELAQQTSDDTTRQWPPQLDDLYQRACAAIGIEDSQWPSMEELTDYAAPHLPAHVRGGYGHVEVGLAARALAQRRAHAVVSVKSFGCMPSTGVSDGIIPSVLGDAVPFLALEISEDGSAARESRLMLCAAAAFERAQQEVQLALQRTGSTQTERAHDPRTEPPLRGRREFACTLAQVISQPVAHANASGCAPPRNDP